MNRKERVVLLVVALLCVVLGDVLVFVHNMPAYAKIVGASMLSLSGWLAGMAVYSESKKTPS